MMRVLLIGGLNREKVIYHYSDLKTLQLALGFCSLGHAVYMPEESDHHNHPLIIKIPMNSIHPHDFHLIIFTRETHIKQYIDEYEVVKNLCHREKQKEQKQIFPIICARYGSYNWYKDVYEDIDEFFNAFDYHFPQEFSYCKRLIADLGHRDGGRIWPSTMAVPKDITFSTHPPFEKNKKILIYIGRLRHTPSRYDFILEFMNSLGSNYKLLIIPGSFNKTTEGEDFVKTNPNNQESKKWLVDKFSTADNIEVLSPIPWGQHWDYLYHSDYGLDFSPYITKGFGGGNAKLVEYMRAGLPTITEPSVINSWLIPLCKGGVIASSSYNMDFYKSAFRTLENTNWDKGSIARIMTETNNWEVRASEIISYIGNTEDINLDVY